MLEIIKSIGLFDIIDMAIIAIVVYNLLLLIKGTRALPMLMGIMLIVIVSFAARYLGLKTTSWVLDNFTGYLFIIIVVLFQQEIRRALAFIGETKVFGTQAKAKSVILDEIVKAATVLANRQIGALIVLQRNTDLEHFLDDTGQKLDCMISREILISIFIPYSPLHDGAVIISNGRISTAGSILPLTRKTDLGKNYGTRHRAAVGVTEETDAIAIAVSEEKGSITVAQNGELSEELNADKLRKLLDSIFNQQAKSVKKNDNN
ncbi:diadenylate cyclase CdaA [Seleniivibrio sp.]|uniref:diadenylate cyclase CdaA n=1 Tax=Seleniivibrio sp. TaxID=2898801 RepID=UPI0025E61C59|nr:diadenylate cyclase CdaA [Seleniivibrio sp.]MCD8554223.1 diadenylate cyclase CdaA [Seleniivibrio sp.]